MRLAQPYSLVHSHIGLVRFRCQKRRRFFRPETTSWPAGCRPRAYVLSRTHADYQSACSPGAEEDRHENQEPGAAGEPAEARRVRSRVHADAEEAEFGAPQGCARAADER